MAAPRRAASSAAALTLAFATAVSFAGTAAADPQNELTASWAAGTPATLQNGSPATLTVHINSNDTQGAEGTQDPLVAKVALKKGAIGAIPKVCLTDGVTPASSVSADGSTLTCNLGAVKFGTAKEIQVGAVAAGATGDNLEATVTAAAASPVNLTPIPIVATPGVDLMFNDDTAVVNPGSREASTTIQLPFAIAVPRGAENLDGSSISFLITATDTGVSQTSLAAALDVSGAMRGQSDQNSVLGRGGNYPDTPKNSNATAGGTGATIKVVKVSTGVFRVELSNIDTTLSNLPKTMRDGTPISADRLMLVSGTVELLANAPLFDADKAANSANFTASAVTVKTASGAPAPDVDASNQTERRSITVAGTYSASWNYAGGTTYAGNALTGQGRNWSNNGYVLPGDVAFTGASSSVGAGTAPQNATAGYGMCTVLDYKHSRLATTLGSVDGDPLGAPRIDYSTYGNKADGKYMDLYAFIGDPGSIMDFRCDDSKSWVRLKDVTDPSTVGAVRVSWTKDQWTTNNRRRTQINLPLTILPGSAGQDIWTATTFTNTPGTGTSQLTWPSATSMNAAVTNDSLPGDRWPQTTSITDVIHIADHRVGADKTALPRPCRLGGAR